MDNNYDAINSVGINKHDNCDEYGQPVMDVDEWFRSGQQHNENQNENGDESIENDGDKKVYKLPLWDGNIGPYNTVAFFASRNSGKSFAIRWLLYLNQHKFPLVIVICPSECTNHFYRHIIPDAFIFDSVDENTINMIKNIMYKRQQQIKDNPPPFLQGEYAHNVLIIMDDCMTEPSKFLNHPIIKALYKMGRHFKIGLWVVVQYFNDLHASLRPNVDVSVILKTEDPKLQAKFQSLVGSIPDKYEFGQILNEATSDFGCLVKDSKRGIFWYKAQEIKDWKMNPDQWNFSNVHYTGDAYGGGPEKKKIDWNKIDRRSYMETPLFNDPIKSKKTTAAAAKKIDKSKPFQLIIKEKETGTGMSLGVGGNNNSNNTNNNQQNNNNQMMNMNQMYSNNNNQMMNMNQINNQMYSNSNQYQQHINQNAYNNNNNFNFNHNNNRNN
jgi:hypothetical protein